MSRSKFKGPYPFLNPTQYNQLKNNDKKKSRQPFQINRRNTILPDYISKKFQVHNGKKWIKLTIKEDMLGLKIGSFVFSRSVYKYKKKKK